VQNAIIVASAHLLIFGWYGCHPWGLAQLVI